MKLLFILLVIFLSQNSHSFGYKQVDLSKIKKISLVYADTAQDLESSFGHIALRLSEGKGRSLYDVSAEFVANTSEVKSSVELYMRGAGVYDPFAVIIQYDSFENYKRKKTLLENRQLKIIELDLSQKQLQDFLKFMDDFQNNKISQKYYFLTSNCAEIPIRALEVVTKQNIDWSNIPNIAIKKILSMSFAKKTTIIENASTQRVEYIKKYIYKKKAPFEIYSWNKNFIKDLKSPKYIQRQKTYLKILWLRLNNKITQRRYRNFFIRFKILETGFDKYVFSKIFDYKHLRTKKLLTMSLPLSGRVKKNLAQVALSIDEHKPALMVQYDRLEIKSQAHRKVRKVVPVKRLIKLKNFQYHNESRTLSFEGKLVGTFIDTGITQFLLERDILIESEVLTNQGATFLNILILLDSTPFVENINNSLKSVESQGQISLLNTNKKLNDGIGACHALLLIQKALDKRAFFSMEKKNTLNSDDSIKLLSDVLAGNFVLVQGFKNITDFTRSIEQEKLIEFVNTVQKEKTTSPISTIWKNFTKKIQLTSKNFNSFKALLKEGYSVVLNLAFIDVSSESPKLASRLAHVLYVHKLTKIRDGTYKVFAYDPNFGTGEYYYLREDSKGNMLLEFYEKMNLLLNKGDLEIWPIIDEITEEEVQASSFLNNLEFNQKKLDQLDSGIIPFKDLYKFLK